MPPAYDSQLGNDDQAFWAIASLTAYEYKFPTPPQKSSKFWLDLVENVFKSMSPRWGMAQCNGGLQWQIFESNPGWGYKNSISNGGLFQIAARLYKITGNKMYLNWCDKVWNWMDGVGLIGPGFSVFDGAGSTGNCTDINKELWTYNAAMTLYGAAVLTNATKSDLWAHRTSGLLGAAGNAFFSPYRNSTNM